MSTRLARLRLPNLITDSPLLADLKWQAHLIGPASAPGAFAHRSAPTQPLPHILDAATRRGWVFYGDHAVPIAKQEGADGADIDWDALHAHPSGLPPQAEHLLLAARADLITETFEARLRAEGLRPGNGSASANTANPRIYITRLCRDIALLMGLNYSTVYQIVRRRTNIRVTGIPPRPAPVPKTARLSSEPPFDGRYAYLCSQLATLRAIHRRDPHRRRLESLSVHYLAAPSPASPTSNPNPPGNYPTHCPLTQVPLDWEAAVARPRSRGRPRRHPLTQVPMNHIERRPYEPVVVLRSELGLCSADTPLKDDIIVVAYEAVKHRLTPPAPAQAQQTPRMTNAAAAAAAVSTAADIGARIGQLRYPTLSEFRQWVQVVDEDGKVRTLLRAAPSGDTRPCLGARDMYGEPVLFFKHFVAPLRYYVAAAGSPTGAGAQDAEIPRELVTLDAMARLDADLRRLRNEVLDMAMLRLMAAEPGRTAPQYTAKLAALRAVPPEVVAHAAMTGESGRRLMQAVVSEPRLSAQDTHRLRTVTQLVGAVHRRAKDLGVLCTFSRHDLAVDGYPQTCPLTGWELDWPGLYGSAFGWLEPQVIRLDPDDGYVAGNIALACRWVQRLMDGTGALDKLVGYVEGHGLGTPRHDGLMRLQGWLQDFEDRYGRAHPAMARLQQVLTQVSRRGERVSR